MADDDMFSGMSAPPLDEGSAPPADMGFGDDFGAAPPLDGGFEPPPPSTEEALPTFGDAPMGGFEAPMGDMGAMPDMSGGMPDMGAMPDMGGGMPDMGAMPDMGGGMPDMGGGLGNEFVGGGMGGGMELGPVAKWRIEQQERVAAKAQAAAAAAAAKIAEAQEALATFYSERSEKTNKRAAENRAQEASYVEERDAAMIADSWDSVCKMVDLKEKAGQEVDTSRMRALLVQLKHV